MTNYFSDSDKTQQVIQAEREWLDAHLRLDVSALDRLMADEYTQVNSQGELIGKQQILNSFQSGNGTGRKPRAMNIRSGYTEM